MSIKINSLELESVKKIKAVRLEPSENGLTVIGGKNRAGKTSVLDAICWALGGEKYRPSNPKREGDYNEPRLFIELSNGITVERRGKNSELKVTDKDGNRHGQTLLNSFIEELALNLPKFMQSSSADKAKTLLKIIGVGDKLALLEAEEKRLYDERYAVGRMAEQKKRYAAELPYYEGVPEEPVSIVELIQRQQKILLQNEKNKQQREHYEALKEERIKLIKIISEAQARLDDVNESLEACYKTVEQLEDESTAELEENIASIEELNAKIRANIEKTKASGEFSDLEEAYSNFSMQIDKVRSDKLELLNGADLPLPGLSVENGELTYNGHKWDCISGAEQLRVATAIVRKLKPECGFVLLDGLEAFDIDALNEFGEWLEKEGLQAIATRVSTGDECSIIIQDGVAVTEEEATVEEAGTKWTEGTF